MPKLISFANTPSLILAKKPDISIIYGSYRPYRPQKRYLFETFYHPYVCEFIRQLNRYGIDGLLQRPIQFRSHDFFEVDYDPHAKPVEVVEQPYPSEDVDFSRKGSYTQYNWELFFHIPLLIADRLSKNQRFEEAQKWFHYIFDPTDVVLSGLLATYFNNPDLAGPPVITCFEDTVNLSGSPHPAIALENFSARWIGKVVPQYSEDYTFYTKVDDGVRLWINNQLLINEWRNQVNEFKVTISLKEGVSYDIRMEFYQGPGGAVAQLFWESPSTPKAIIPQSQLRPWATPYWKVRPFIENQDVKKKIDELLMLLDSNSNDPQKEEMKNQVTEWRDNPFNPHLIARLRLTAYQKNVVMKYIDNLIAWGDQLFRRDTIESINEAMLLYILAAEILGPRPQNLPAQKIGKGRTYKELETSLDDFSNALVEIESHLPATGSAPPPGQTNQPLPTFYFCIPKNDKLLGYWDTVADRLFKILHCMNIEGVVRELPLFEPQIDPALLVRAVAAGVDISSALNDLNAPLPHYRFNVMLQKATELCNDVKALGSALLAALEKKDAEELALLRSSHEIALLEAVRDIKKQQIEEAKNTLEGLKKSREVVSLRYNYYKDIPFLNPGEAAHLRLVGQSLAFQTIQAIMDQLASGLSYVPDFKIGSPSTIGNTFGGTNLSNAMRAYSAFMGAQASITSATGSMSATVGGHQRRWDDWKLQERLAAKELEQLDKQIAATEIRLAIAEKELQNNDLQVENAKEVDEYMRNKFTNRELYDWMVGQISSIYFQSYQLAYDIAKRAERTYRFELGLSDSNFIQFGYWDSLKKGLLAGEKLHYDLRRMEMAYLDQNKREYEITKHVSLLLHDPMALMALKKTGTCIVEFPEALFDADYPGHYMRRIKTVSITLPCVVGPYTGINCTLTLLSNTTRIKSVPADPYPQSEDGEDQRFVMNFVAMQSIATSSGQNDPGLFELNFRGELYLPFEGAGAVSRWRIHMPPDTNAFDLDTLSDVVLHLKYTAREGGEILKNAAKGAVKSAIADVGNTPLARLFSLRHEFPTEWYRFLNPTGDTGTLEMDLTAERFPFLFRGKKLTIGSVKFFLDLKEGVAYEDGALTITVGARALEPANSLPVQLAAPALTRSGSPIGGVPFAKPENTTIEIPKGLVLTASKTDLSKYTIEDLWLVCEYSVK